MKLKIDEFKTCDRIAKAAFDLMMLENELKKIEGLKNLEQRVLTLVKARLEPVTIELNILSEILLGFDLADDNYELENELTGLEFFEEDFQ